MTLHENAGAAVATEEPAGAAGPEPVAAEPAPDLGARLTELAVAVAELQQEVRAADERSAARESMIERLHEDNQKLRAGERRLLLMPVLTDLQRLRNDLLRQAGAVGNGLDAGEVAGLLGSYAQSLELTLERGGVAPIRPAAGDAFDPARHRPDGVLPAPRPEDHDRIAAVLSDGYLDTTSGRALTPATVRVHRWTEPVTAPLEKEDHV
uniref:nucleotide exchange factor GrpE n=1 Tax=Paractinoplanes polyasparticus TaxID=2856853 RepID=UPI001C862AD1|nr:nucleotide exchange factor GrpE [Actinoplanes polyasparticus]